MCSAQLKNGLVECVSRKPISIVDQMPVCIDCRRDGLVAQTCRDHVDGYTSSKKPRGMSMAQIVQYRPLGVQPLPRKFLQCRAPDMVMEPPVAQVASLLGYGRGL